MASPPPSRVLLVEPWFAGSHRAWAEGLIAHSRHDMSLLAEEPGSWRDTFDNAAARLARRVEQAPDLLLLSSMMDAGAFLRQTNFTVPVIVYMHENQLTYDRDRPDLERGEKNWRSIRAADTTVFNSTFHSDDFHSAAARLLRLPDSEVAASHQAARVLPVGIEIPPGRDQGRETEITILWNHRWERDKDPDSFLRALIANAHHPFRLILLGGGSRREHHVSRLVEHFGDRVAYAGYAPRDEYARLLASADLAVSCARQEFFGVSIAEAMAAGAVPLVPDDLAYPELLGANLSSCRYESGSLTEALASVLADPAGVARLRPAAVEAGQRFTWANVAPRYDRLIDSMV